MAVASVEWCKADILVNSGAQIIKKFSININLKMVNIW